MLIAVPLTQMRGDMFEKRSSAEDTEFGCLWNNQMHWKCKSQGVYNTDPRLFEIMGNEFSVGKQSDGSGV